jgi:hypothetical protein
MIASSGPPWTSSVARRPCSFGDRRLGAIVPRLMSRFSIVPFLICALVISDAGRRRRAADDERHDDADDDCVPHVVVLGSRRPPPSIASR